jgi:hypothetical protein
MSCVFVVSLAMSAAVIPSSGPLIPLAMLALAMSPVSIIFLPVSPFLNR